MRGQIIYGGRNLSDFGLYVNGRETYKSPNKSYSLVSIKGRSGDLVVNEKRLENVDLTYPASFIYEDFEENFSSLRNFLLSLNGYQRLEDTYHPNEYRMALCRTGLEPDVDMYNKFGQFDLSFECKPQRYLKVGENPIEITSRTYKLFNPTYFSSKPFIRVYGTGTIGINHNSITINSNTNYTDIDCELMDAFYGSESRNQNISFSNLDFPELISGGNDISLSSSITKIIITPRWYIV